MAISATIQRIIYQYLGLLTILFLTKVSGSLFGRRHSTTIIPPQDNHVTVYTGDTAVLKCQVDNIGPTSIAWRKVSQDYPISVGQMMYAPIDEMSIDYQETKHTTHANLVIKRTLPSHAGTYECQLIASEVKLRHIELTVLTERPVLKQSIKLDGSVYLSPKQRLNLTCNATGTSRAPEYIDWFHNGNLIEERKLQWRNRAAISSFKPKIPGRSLVSTLTVEQARPSDAGIYVCRSMTPTYNSAVDTTSITVHILSAEKDHMKKREGDDKTKAHELTKNDRNVTVRICVGYYVILLIVLLHVLR